MLLVPCVRPLSVKSPPGKKCTCAGGMYRALSLRSTSLTLASGPHGVECRLLLQQLFGQQLGLRFVKPTRQHSGTYLCVADRHNFASWPQQNWQGPYEPMCKKRITRPDGRPFKTALRMKQLAAQAFPRGPRDLAGKYCAWPSSAVALFFLRTGVCGNPEIW